MSRVKLNQYIVADSEICGGQPTFDGTRVMVWQVLEILAAGETVEELLADYPSITHEHISAALDYAAKVIGSERVIPVAAPLRQYETVS